MKKIKFRYIAGLILSSIMVAAAAIPLTKNIVDATSATTYTRTHNADNKVIRCQDGYLPQTTYDRIGLSSPQDMVIDVIDDVEYGYVLNKGGIGESPFLIKFRLDDVTNTVDKIDLGVLNDIKNPTGLWIQTTTVQVDQNTRITQKELYIVDGDAKFSETIQPSNEDIAFGLSEYTYNYNGLIYRVPFDSINGTKLEFERSERIHEPTQVVSKTDYNMYMLVTKETIEEFDGYQIIPTASNFKDKNVDNTGAVTSYNRIVCKPGLKCENRIVPLGQYIMKTPSFGQETIFRPKKVAVDSSGNMFIASDGTDSGMIQLSYTGDFISFFVVNAVSYNFLYQIIKNFGTKEQLNKLNVDKPKAFSNVFVDSKNLVYSVTTEHTKIFDKYSTGGSSVLEYQLNGNGSDQVTDSFVTNDGLIFLVMKTGLIYVCAPTGQIIFFFGIQKEPATPTDIIGFFKNLTSIMVDKNNNIWVVDAETNYLQTFTPTDYAKSIFSAISLFNKQDYEGSRKAWEQVLKYDSLSVLANDGLGKAYYYDMDFEESLKYFSVSKNRTLYSNVFWELRNDYLQDNLAAIFIIIVAVVLVIVGLKALFNKNKKLIEFKQKVKSVNNKRWFKDLTVGFRLIVKPNDTFYELKTHKRGSILGATLYYILGIIAFLLNTYCYALPFQYVTTNTLNPSTVLFAAIGVLGIFVLCNYLVSAINDGEGTFADIYKFTGYSMLPMIICLPISVGISYGLTLNEEVILTLLKGIGFWGTGIILVIGILETHNYTFGQTVKNILLTIIFMVLFLIICVVVVVMLDQIKTFIEQIWREVKLRANWY